MHRSMPARLISTLPAYLLTLLIAGALKSHYRAADAEQLRWILAPTAKLVNIFSGSDYQFLMGLGWCEPAAEFIIAPACAGVNFMILLLILGVILHVHQLPKRILQFAWLLFTLAAAYGGTVLVNSCRILISIQLYQANIYGPWLTPERIHRLAGVIIYLSALWILLCWLRILIRTVSASNISQSQFSDFLIKWRHYLVFMVYSVLTVLIPLFNGAYARFGHQFFEHTMTILFIGLAFCLANHRRNERASELKPKTESPRGVWK